MTLKIPKLTFFENLKENQIKMKAKKMILGSISGKIRRRSIRILEGDRVKIELSQYDDARGRIIDRFPHFTKQVFLQEVDSKYLKMQFRGYQQ